MSSDFSDKDDILVLPDDEPEALEPGPGYSGPKLSFGGWIFFAIITVVLALLIKLFLLQTFKIPSPSMHPTLQIGDHIIVNKIAYGLRHPIFDRPLVQGEEPQFGDVVVFRGWEAARQDAQTGNEYFIKRLVGLPGDIVEVHDYQVYLNGEVLPGLAQSGNESESAAVERIKNYGPLKLLAEQYFVLGDNRSNSQDSRTYGPVLRHSIIGRAVLVYWSWVRVDGNLEIAIGRIGLPIE